MENKGRYVIRDVNDPEEKKRQIEEMFRDISRETLRRRAKREARKINNLEGSKVGTVPTFEEGT